MDNPSPQSKRHATQALGRPPRQRGMIASTLRERIASNHWRPGERLTPRRELIRELNVSMTALQGAIEQLHREGFIEKYAGRGTFVAARPPHSHQFALIVPEADNYFYRLLADEAEARHRADHHLRFRLYRMPLMPDVREHPQFAKLTGDIRRRLVGGLIMSIEPSPTLTRLLDLARETQMPTVVLGDALVSGGFPAVHGDYRSFFDQAIDHLRGRGRRRIAVLCHAAWYDLHGRHFEAALDAAGLPFSPLRVQNVLLPHPRAVRNVVQLMFTAPPKVRPDGLILLDYRSLGTVQEALENIGFRVGEGMDGVVSVNFPFDRDTILRPGFACLGFDGGELFDAMLAQVVPDAPVTPDAPDPGPADQAAAREVLVPPRFATPRDFQPDPA